MEYKVGDRVVVKLELEFKDGLPYYLGHIAEIKDGLFKFVADNTGWDMISPSQIVGYGIMSPFKGSIPEHAVNQFLNLSSQFISIPDVLTPQQLEVEREFMTEFSKIVKKTNKFLDGKHIYRIAKIAIEANIF